MQNINDEGGGEPPFYIARFLMEIGDLAILCPFTDAHADGKSLFISHKGASYKEVHIYGIFNSAVTVLQTLVIALGASLGIWGAINLLEGYGNDNRATRS